MSSLSSRFRYCMTVASASSGTTDERELIPAGGKPSRLPQLSLAARINC
jgi:hypothetical protein